MSDAWAQIHFAAQCIAQCGFGFTNEHHWQAWLKKHRAEIEALPPHLRKRVLLAHDQATCREFSTPSGATEPKGNSARLKRVKVAPPIGSDE